VGRSCLLRSGSSGDTEYIEQLVDEAHLVLDVRLAHQAMTAADHPHHLEALDRSRRPLHCLKASDRTNNSLECAMIGFDDVIQVFAGPVFCVDRQLSFSLQPADSLRI
jgi:hypothetical protein